MTAHGNEVTTTINCAKVNSSLDAAGGLTGWQDRAVISIATSDATATACGVVALDPDGAYYIEAVIVFGEPLGGSRGAFKLACTAYQSGGTGANIQGAVTILHSSSSTAATANLVISGGDVIVEVRGVAATNLTWEVKISTLDIGS